VRRHRVAVEQAGGGEQQRAFANRRDEFGVAAHLFQKAEIGGVAHELDQGAGVAARDPKARHRRRPRRMIWRRFEAKAIAKRQRVAMLGDELDVVVRPAEKLVRARDIKHVDLVVYRNADEHLSFPRLRKLTNFTSPASQFKVEFAKNSRKFATPWRDATMSDSTLRIRRSITDLQDDYKGQQKPLEDVMRAWKGLKSFRRTIRDRSSMLGGYHASRSAAAGWGNSSYWAVIANHGNVLFPPGTGFICSSWKRAAQYSGLRRCRAAVLGRDQR